MSGEGLNDVDNYNFVSDIYPDDEDELPLKIPNSPRTTRMMMSKTTKRIAPQINFLRRADLWSIK